MNKLTQRLEAARAKAFQNGVPIRRQDIALYRLLAECLSIADTVSSKEIYEELRTVFLSRTLEGEKKFLLTGNPILLVCRYVLEGQDNRNSIYRYAKSLEEARRRNIDASSLEDWLHRNGGIKALFLAREIQARTITARTLHLEESVLVYKDTAFTLTLRYNGRGFYRVIKTRQGE